MSPCYTVGLANWPLRLLATNVNIAYLYPLNGSEKHGELAPFVQSRAEDRPLHRGILPHNIVLGNCQFELKGPDEREDQRFHSVSVRNGN